MFAYSSSDPAIDYKFQDPGSVTLVWAFYELARNPEIVKKLRQEVAST